MSIRTIAEAKAFRRKIESAAQHLPVDEALNSVELFEKWNAVKAYATGDRVVENNILYKAKQDITANPNWNPSAVPALWEPVANPSEAGTLDNPITAVAGMTYIKGLYYTENGTVYLCIRDDSADGSGTSLYYLPSALVGSYFKKIN